MVRHLLSAVFLLMSCGFVAGHELPDGAVERRIQVSVKPDRVLMEYSIAMNAVTLKMELKAHGVSLAKTDDERRKQYQEVVLRSLPKKMRLTLDGESAAIKPVRADYSGWSHPHLTCLFRAELEAFDRSASIAFSDENFPNASGSYRIAMKGRSGVRVINSTVPALVSQARPVELEDLSKSQRATVMMAKGEIVVDGREDGRGESR
ncbi:MAG: hypothetical protein AAGJ83_07990 [Planctomycetota bacterium]